VASNLQLKSQHLVYLVGAVSAICVRAHPEMHKEAFLGSAVCSRLSAASGKSKVTEEVISLAAREKSRLHLHTCTRV
jgi:hypothetical protein